MAKVRASIAPQRSKRRPISGPAMVVFLLVLAGIWFGSQSLATSRTVTVDNTSPAQGGGSPDEIPAQGAENQTAPAEPSPAEPASEQNAPAPSQSTPTTSGAALPNGYPASIPAPKGGTVTGSFASEEGSRKSFVVTYSVLGSGNEVSASFRSALEKAGFTIDELPGFDFGGSGGFYGAAKGNASLTVSVADDQEKAGSSVLTINATVE